MILILGIEMCEIEVDTFQWMLFAANRLSHMLTTSNFGKSHLCLKRGDSSFERFLKYRKIHRPRLLPTAIYSF